MISSYTLTVAITGPGTVTSSPAGINCGSDCSEAYASGTQVTLTAKPNSNGATFSGWSGGCAGTSVSCTLTMQAAKGVTAAFKKKGGPKSNNVTLEEISTETVESEEVPSEIVAAMTEATEIGGRRTSAEADAQQ